MFLLAISFFEVNARKFYFSSTSGNDSYTTTQAQNQATPWKTLIKLQTFGNSGQAMPGDTFLFKRGDTFTNGRDEWGSFKWWAIAGYTCPSGTASKPIVFTNYGDTALQRPNFLFPNPSVTRSQDKYVLTFEGVGYIVIDGLQFNDTRFPINDKISSAYTAAGLVLGELPTAQRTHHMTVKNCNFSNIGYGIISAGSYIDIVNNTFTNFKSVGDTIGGNDIGADPLVPTGSHYQIKNNYFSGSWAYANPNSSSEGLLGGALESIDDFDSSMICHNTFIDCSGGMEFGQISGSQYGPNDDTFAYNLFINVRVVSYVNTGSSPFACNAARLRFWNNVIIENHNSRFSGANFGNDVLGDGQSFRNFNFWPSFPLNQSSNTGSRVFQYTSDIGVAADTLYDIRNNIIWNNTRQSILYDNSRTKFFHSNNLYKLGGGSTLGGALSTGNSLEQSTTNQIFTDTSNINPINWNLHLNVGSPAINFGRNVGIVSDIDGTPLVGNPDAGVQEYMGVVSSLTVTATPGTITCYGGTTNVSVTASGGTPPYNGTGTFTSTGGTQLYTVLDATGTRQTATIVIPQPSAIVPTVTAGRIIIFGNTTSISASATGGTGSYTYKLNSGTYQTSETFTNVAAGTHTITVKDANNCTATSTIVINQPAALLNLTLSAASNPIACNGGNTTITANATGGTVPYTYSLGSGTYQTSNQFTGITAGTYTFNVKDSNGITKSTSITLTQPSTALSGNVSSGTISSYGGKTTITVSSVSGGTAPYSYSLNGGTFQTTTSFSNVGAGTHSITLKDSRGCTLIKTITITQPASTLACASAASSIACNGGTATVTVTATGGTAPYTGTGTFTVSAGTYSYNVTDAAGSVKTTTITVGQPTSINSTVTSGRILINGGATSITVTANGGTGAFTYKLNNNNYQTSNVFGNILAGVDTVYVKDANGCVASSIISIDQPSQLVASSNVTPINCFGGTAQVAINATGGIPPYTGIGNFNVIAGNYNYTVIDSAGATQNISLTINQPTQLTSPTLTQGAQITVYGSATTVTVSAVSGGTAPYTYSVDNGIFQTSNVLSITGGAHVVNVKDSKGCTISKSINISQPLKIFLVAKTDQTCAGIANGSLTMKADGGVRPYTYRIYKINNTTYTTNTYPYQSDSVFNGLAPNFYTIRVKDNAGTLDTLTIKITATTITCNRGLNNNIENESESKANAIDKGLHIFPNPSSTEFNIIPNYLMNGNFTYQLYNSTGQRVGEGQLNNGINTPIGKDFKSGIYYLKVMNGEFIETKKLIKL